MNSSLVLNSNTSNIISVKRGGGDESDLIEANDLTTLHPYYMPQVIPQYLQQQQSQSQQVVIAPFVAAVPLPQQQAPPPPPPPVLPQVLSDEETRLELLKTFEYYFSTKNLTKDSYLLSQMDAEDYVSVQKIANFPKIKHLTNDMELIKAIIRLSTQIELDPPTQSKVRSKNGRNGGIITVKNISKLLAAQSQDIVASDASLNVIASPPPAVGGAAAAPVLAAVAAVAAANHSSPSPTTPVSSSSAQKCILILREVCSEATLDQIKDLFTDKEPQCPVFVQCESAGNDSWYVTFTNEDQAQRALQYLKTEVQSFMDKPIRARIKHVLQPRAASTSTPLAVSATSPVSTPPPPQTPATFNNLAGQYNANSSAAVASPMSPQQHIHMGYATPVRYADSTPNADMISVQQQPNWPPQQQQQQQYWAQQTLGYDLPSARLGYL